jgi:hypothetical protein
MPMTIRPASTIVLLVCKRLTPLVDIPLYHLRPLPPYSTKNASPKTRKIHHVLQIRALMASDEWESKGQDAVLLALGAAA